MTEVLVLPRESYHRLCDTWPPIASQEQISFLTGLEVLVNTSSFFMDREKAEEDEDFLQLIPYILLHNEHGHLFGYTRKGGDERLLGKVSLGLGGHVEPQDGDPCFRTVLSCAARELREEVGVPIVPFPTGDVILRDDDPVERVHLGILMAVAVDETRVQILEPENIEGRFHTRKEVIEIPLNQLESWSRAAREHYLGDKDHGY